MFIPRQNPDVPPGESAPIEAVPQESPVPSISENTVANESMPEMKQESEAAEASPKMEGWFLK